ncbi:MAG: Uma2 family endonuclease [Pyrinomonadaceae bacterium]
MVSNPKTFLTEEEYLAFERQSEFKHEFFNGEVFAMTGVRRAHARIATNLSTSLDNQLRDATCNVYSGDLRVKVPSTGLYTYPDLIVTCGEEKFADDEFDTLLNPIVLIEILSSSTEAYDRGRKFENYQAIESFREYVLVSQTARRIEHYLRESGSEWHYREIREAGSKIRLPTIECELNLDEVYAKVVFTDD